MDWPNRAARRRHHGRAASRLQRHAQPRRRRGTDDRRAPATTRALAVLPAASAAARHRRGWPSESRRLPAGGVVAAAHVGWRPALVRQRASRRRHGDAPFDHLECRDERRPERLARVRNGDPRDLARTGHCRTRGTRHRLPRSPEPEHCRDNAAARTRRRGFQPSYHARSGAAVPIFGADVQRSPHSL